MIEENKSYKNFAKAWIICVGIFGLYYCDLSPNLTFTLQLILLLMMCRLTSLYYLLMRERIIRERRVKENKQLQQNEVHELALSNMFSAESKVKEHSR